LAFCKQDLVADLKSEVSGKFKSVIISLMLPAVEYCAKELHEAIKKFARKEALLEDISLFGSDSETLSLASAYEASMIEHK
jgi:annexin A7/11